MEENPMKKIKIILCCFFLITLVVFVGDGAAQPQPISRGDLPDLKGKWKGERSVKTGERMNTDLEISNDTLPLECKLIFYEVKSTGTGGRGPERTETREFKAKINEKGNLYSKWGNFEMELSLYRSGGNMKLEGDFYWGGARGTISVKKK
jgi:hypothetical protein